MTFKDSRSLSSYRHINTNVYILLTRKESRSEVDIGHPTFTGHLHKHTGRHESWNAYEAHNWQLKHTSWPQCDNTLMCKLPQRLNSFSQPNDSIWSDLIVAIKENYYYYYWLYLMAAHSGIIQGVLHMSDQIVNCSQVPWVKALDAWLTIRSDMQCALSDADK